MMPSDTQIASMKEYLNSQMTGYMAMLHSMVEINSYTNNPAGIHELSGLTASLFEPMGFAPEMVPSVNPQCGSHLVLSRNGTTPRKIGCVSHLDTVFTAEEEKTNDFRWRMEGDRIYGPGTNDIKGGTVVMYMMIDALGRFFPDVFRELTWVLLFDATEESESDDFGLLCRERLKDNCPACLVFEGGDRDSDNDVLVTSRKGRAVFRVTAHGRGAHSGTDHHKGASAIMQMAEAVRRIEGLTDYGRSLTFNMGTIRGGTELNRVPHYCEAWVEMRALDPEVFNEGVSGMLSIDGLSTVKSADGSFSAGLKVELMRKNPAWPENPGTNRLLECFRAAGKLMGAGIIAEARGGISDGNLIWDQVPVIDGLGPAGCNAHCSEWSADGSKDQEYALASSFVHKSLLCALGILEIHNRRNNRP